VLFRSTNNTHEKQNLLVFLRPTVIANKERVAEVSRRKYSNVWEVEIEGIDPLELMNKSLDGEHQFIPAK
jgi:general secretion pathway protein D